ncbi:MAG: NifB/NifX family molybdenum-iron cluster-binding protein [Bacteroidales bacterium]|nr:NifB/NifX family molybdenum-iron cluster-binding protein [Bacteroidales bacterium]
MKIAVPTRDFFVDEHFGHCEYYSIYSISEDNKIIKEELMKSPQGCGCKSDIAITLRQMGVDTMLAGNMGQGAVNKVTESGIKVYRGCAGKVREQVELFLKGQVVDSGETCSDHHHHGEDGQCDHQ